MGCFNQVIILYSALGTFLKGKGFFGGKPIFFEFC